MNRKQLTKLSYFTFFILLFLFLLYPFNVNATSIQIRLFFNFVILCSLSFAIYLHAGFADQIQIRKILHYATIFLFLFYVFQLIYMLFMAPEFARDQADIYGNYRQNLHSQWMYNTNLRPFKTIQTMLAIFKNHAVSDSVAYINLVGNFVAFMPFGLFLPLLFKKMRKPIIFMLSISLIIIVVEVLQLLTLTGSMDIDDYILNFTGALCFYILVHYYLKKYSARHLF